ncbi:MAG: hypothetical protein WBY93_08540 [Candidatus Binatus sp.]
MRRLNQEFSLRRLTQAIVALVLVCGTASRGWCANLWLAEHHNHTVESFTSSQLKKSGSPTPGGIVDIAASGVAFDKSKNLWVVVDYDEVDEFTAAQVKKLSSNDSPAPAAIITSSSTFQEILSCAFDKKGNLWLTDLVAGTLDELSKAQLAKGSADLTPAVVISSADLQPGGPDFVTFDKSGDAWIDNETESKVVEFTPGQLKSGGDQSGNVVLTTDGSGSLEYPGEPAFDSKGNLWLANYLGQTVVEFTKKELKASGSPTPAVTLSDQDGSLIGPWGAVFDGNGDLLITNFDGGSISKFTPNQLKTSGAPVPPVFLTGEAYNSYELIFGP